MGQGNGRLEGRRVLVTRSRAQASRLCELIEREGGRPVPFPTIEFRAPSDWSRIDAAVHALGSYDWAVLTSANGVSVWTERLRHLGVGPGNHPAVRYAVVGPATAQALERWGRTPDLVPAEAVAEALLEALLATGVRGKRVLLPQAAAARDVLARGLREAGAIVDDVPLYHTVPGGGAGGEVLALLRGGRLDAATFTSSSTVSNFVALVDGAANLLSSTRVACIGPVTGDTARALGIRVDAVAGEHTIEGLVEALVSVLAAPDSGRGRDYPNDRALGCGRPAAHQREEG